MNKFHISFSEFRGFLSCEFKHFLNYVLKVSEPTNEILVFGKAIHLCIETMFKEGLEKQYDYSELWLKCIGDVVDSENANSEWKKSNEFKRQAVKILNRLNLKERFKDYELIGAELDLYEPLITINEQIISFKGIIDLVLKHKINNTYVIIDWKSAKEPWDLKKKLKDKLFFGQLALYKYFFSNKYNVNIENIETRFIVLAKNSEPVIQEYHINISNNFMNEVLEKLIITAEKIYTLNPNKQIKAKYTSNNFACNWCGFNRTLCNGLPNQTIKLEQING